MNKTYILVHGAWHGSWCWKYLIPLLTEQNHHVIALDLPGHGSNQQSFDTINLTTYVDYVKSIIATCSTPPILIGHSLGGVILSQIAEDLPDKIDSLIFIAGFIPEHSSSLLIEAKKNQSEGLGSETNLDKQAHAIHVAQSTKVIELLYHRCNSLDAAYALALLQSEPSQPMIDTISISTQRFGRVKKTYIACVDDKALSLTDQERMYQKTNCQVIHLDADHSPFFSAPHALADAILTIC